MYHRLTGTQASCPVIERQHTRSPRGLTRTLRALALVLAASAALLGNHGTAQAQTEVAYGWSLIPSGLAVGKKFRLLFISSTKRNAVSTKIADYNTHVQNAAAAGHTDIRDYSSGFRVVGSTSTVDARDNTSTTGTGVPIYWLNGQQGRRQLRRLLRRNVGRRGQPQDRVRNAKFPIRDPHRDQL